MFSFFLEFIVFSGFPARSVTHWQFVTIREPRFNWAVRKHLNTKRHPSFAKWQAVVWFSSSLTRCVQRLPPRRLQTGRWLGLFDVYVKSVKAEDSEHSALWLMKLHVQMYALAIVTQPLHEYCHPLPPANTWQVHTQSSCWMRNLKDNFSHYCKFTFYHVIILP